MKLTKTLFTLFLVTIFAININYAQSKVSVVSKVTATWCPNCGTWGWDYFDALKDIYDNDHKATLLGVHHSGDLKNNVSSWFANNLNFTYQPQFFHNNQQVDVTRNNWEDKVDDMNELIDVYTAESPSVYFNFLSAYVMEDQINCVLTVDASRKSLVDNYLAIYVFENNVLNQQTSRGMALHPNVLRSVMNDNNYGELIDSNNPVFQKKFTLDMDPSWDKDNLGLLAIIWEEDNSTYKFINASSIFNIGLLSSSQELLDESTVEVRYLEDGFQLNVKDGEEYEVFFYNSNAQMIQKRTFRHSTTLDSSNLPAGIYSIHISRDNKVYTQQVFVK